MDSFSTNQVSYQSSADRVSVVGPSLTNRSRVTNGSKLVAAVDGRSASARRYKDVAFSLADDLGGASGLTEAQRALIRQIAAMTVQSERLQGAVLRGELVDVEQLTRLSNALSRMLHRLGLKKPRARPASPLAEHFSRPPGSAA
jgi:hypothetical protein